MRLTGYPTSGLAAKQRPDTAVKIYRSKLLSVDDDDGRTRTYFSRKAAKVNLITFFMSSGR